MDRRSRRVADVPTLRGERFRRADATNRRLVAQQTRHAPDMSSVPHQGLRSIYAGTHLVEGSAGGLHQGEDHSRSSERAVC